MPWVPKYPKLRKFVMPVYLRRATHRMLAQLVQSTALTGRGSAVRARYVLLKKPQINWIWGFFCENRIIFGPFCRLNLLIGRWLGTA